MKEDFLTQFVGNKDRAQLLRVFTFNPTEIFTITSLAKRAGITTGAAGRELKLLEKWGLVKKNKVTTARIVKVVTTRSKAKAPAKQDVWSANLDFKHIRAVSGFVHEISPVQYDSIVDALKRSGKISAVILSGSFMGDASRPADLIVAADPLNERRLETAIRGLEPIFGREIRYAAFSTPEFRYRLTIQDRLIRDTLDFPHLVLLDRTRLL